jgi:hypothetical protein
MELNVFKNQFLNTKPKQSNYQPARRKHMKPIISLLWGLVVLAICHLTAWADISAPPQNIQLQIGSIPTTKSITQYGITWTFAEPVPFGQFVNGDFWVVDPGNGVEIINITPGDAIRTGTTQHMNGSMLNPHTALQGYDGYYNPYGYQNYDASKNVGIGISPSTPLTLSGNISLVSTESNLLPGENHLSYVKNAAVLTCLSSIPPTGCFRPGISSTTKTLHNISSIDYSKLKSLSVSNRPTLQILQAYSDRFKMVWLTHDGAHTARYMHPSGSGMDNYYYAGDFSQAAELLHLDYTKAEKESLLINFMQLGIDLYSYIESGEFGWPPNGGHGSARKWPILFTGIMLDYAPMKNIGQKSGNYLYANGHVPGNPPSDYIHFGEDGQTFYVTQFDVDITNSVAWAPDFRNPGTETRYSVAMLGMPEWAIRHSIDPEVSDASWTSEYRNVYAVPGPSMAGTMMSCLVMGAKSLWNNNAFFDYQDRYWAISRGKADPFGYSVPNQQAGYISGSILWDTYRAKY